jgi:hypothetical protein
VSEHVNPARGEIMTIALEQQRAPEVGDVVSYTRRFDACRIDARRTEGVVTEVTTYDSKDDTESTTVVSVDINLSAIGNPHITYLAPEDLTILDMPELAVGQLWRVKSRGANEYRTARVVRAVTRISADMRMTDTGSMATFALAGPAWSFTGEVEA